MIALVRTACAILVLWVTATFAARPTAWAGEVTIPTDGTPASADLDPRRQPVGQALIYEGPLVGWLSTDRVPDVREPRLAAEAILRERFNPTEMARLRRALASGDALSAEDDALCREAATALWAWVATHVCVDRAVEVAAPRPLAHPLLDGPDPAPLLMDGHGPWGASLRKFGYGLCGSQSYQLVALARAAGFPARMWSLQGGGPDFHATTELGWGGRWHLFDPSLRFHLRLGPEQRVASIAEVVAAPELAARVRDADGYAPHSPEAAAARPQWYALGLSPGPELSPEPPAPPLRVPAGARLTLWNRSTDRPPLKWGPAHYGTGRYEVPLDGPGATGEMVLWMHHMERAAGPEGVALRPHFGREGAIVYSVPALYALRGGRIVCDVEPPPGAELEVAASTTAHAAQRVARYGAFETVRADWHFQQALDDWLAQRLRGPYGAVYRWVGYARDDVGTQRRFFPAFYAERVTQPMLNGPEWQALDGTRDETGRLVFAFTGQNAVPWPLAVRVRISRARGRPVRVRGVMLDAEVQHAPQMQPFARGGAQTWRWSPEPDQPEAAGRIRLTWPDAKPIAEPLQVTWTVTGPVPADGNAFIRAAAEVRDAAGRPVRGLVVRAATTRPDHDRVMPFVRSPLPDGATAGGLYLNATDEDGLYTVYVFSNVPGRSTLRLLAGDGQQLPGEAEIGFLPPDVAPQLN